MLLTLLLIPLVSGDRTVLTNSGPVTGITLTEHNVEAFLGIPYAEPPVGSLRFARTVPKSPWEEVYIADKLPVSCIQAALEEFVSVLGFETTMSEDCLYLNIWVPEGGVDRKAIMVHIHGGGYMTGSSNLKTYDGAALSERGDVIVASMNYRIGSLGFFSAFIEEANGNMGLYDQLMAIQWIKDNAEHFGGDPDNIVLFGESAGSFSVSLHMVSPLSKDLFRRGILQSGSSFHPLYSDDNKEISVGSQVIANLLGCADDDNALKTNPKDVVDCMKSLPAEKFSEKDLIYLLSYGMLIPRVGDDFLPVNPIDSILKGDSKKTEYLIGVTRDEGSLLLGIFRPQIFGLFGEKPDATSFNKTSAREILRSILRAADDNEIIDSYLDRVENESRYTYLKAMSEVAGDYFITCGAVFQADYASLHDNPVFFYMFDYRSNALPLAEWLGVAHSLDCSYVFGNPLYNNLTEFEKQLSEDMMDMWTAFAKTGNPNNPGALKWPLYTPEDQKYFVIGRSDSMGIRPDNYRCEAWKKIFLPIEDDNLIQTSEASVD